MRMASRTVLALYCLFFSCVSQATLAVALTLPTLDRHATGRLADYAGRPVLLNFWGSDCLPCVKEMPMLSAASARHRSLQFIGIAVDDRTKALRFIARQPVAYPQWAASRPAAALLKRFGNPIGALPYTVLLTPRHAICATRLGTVTPAWLAAAIDACGANAVKPGVADR